MTAAIKPGMICEVVGLALPSLRHNNGRFVTVTSQRGVFFGMTAWNIDADPPIQCKCGCTTFRFLLEVQLRPISDPAIDLSARDALSAEKVTS